MSFSNVTNDIWRNWIERGIVPPNEVTTTRWLRYPGIVWYICVTAPHLLANLAQNNPVLQEVSIMEWSRVVKNWPSGRVIIEKTNYQPHLASFRNLFSFQISLFIIFCSNFVINGILQCTMTYFMIYYRVFPGLRITWSIAEWMLNPFPNRTDKHFLRRPSFGLKKDHQ